MSKSESIGDLWFKKNQGISIHRAHKDVKDILYKWEPGSDIRALTYGSIAPVVLSAVPGLAVATTILNVNRFRLWGPGKLLTSVVTTLVPSATTIIAHSYIEKDLLLGLTPCSICAEARAVSLQMLTGVFVPSLIGMMSANHQLVGQAWKPEVIKGFCLVKRDIMKCKNIVIGNAVVQAVVVSLMLHLQRKEWWYVRDELEKRKADAHNKNPSHNKLITELTNKLM
jgi:hypothetical protein